MNGYITLLVYFSWLFCSISTLLQKSFKIFSPDNDQKLQLIVNK